VNRLLSRLLRILAWISAVSVTAAVSTLLGFLLVRGGRVLGPTLFFGDAPPLAAAFGRAVVWDGLWPACVGTLLLVGGAVTLAVPVGVLSGVYLSEYARGPWRRLLGAGVDLLAGIPSVLMGLLGFMLILLLRRTVLPAASPGLLLACGCLALLVLPYVVSTTRTSLEALPESVRLIGPSLGLTRWQAIAHVLLPSGSRGILGGVVLAVGRAAEDTAVILLTGVVANAGLPRGPADRFEALPFEIYYLAAQHQSPAELDQAFGAAVVLLGLTGGIFAGAHLLHRSLERRWT
jgi:phosphate transport system permease protein